MIDPSSRERLSPSLLDRLTDDAPEATRERPDQQALTLPQLRAAVLRDLAWLFNTTNLDETVDLDDFPRVKKSMLNFGIPGFAGLIATARTMGDLETALTQAIVAFEPRIRASTVRVRARPTEDAAMPSLGFVVEGELWAQPLPLDLFVETAIDLETRFATVVATERPR